MKQNYYLGLDMGTSSLGWAVTDADYHLMRTKGKDLWGVRLFQEAESAASRRMHRVSRRRLQRERARIGFVRDVFSDAINEVDPGFYQRLDDSKYFPEDKTEKQPFALFSGKEYTDREYYKQYPTIFHLRSDLIHSNDPKDVRLVYLAILNIFKHRGHFLNANLTGRESSGVEDIYALLAERNVNLPLSADMESLKKILSTNKVNNTHRYEQLSELLSISRKMPESEMLKMVCGLKGSLSKAFPDTEFDEEHQKYSVSFRDGNYEEKDMELISFLNEEDYETVQLLKQMHDWGLLANAMRGEQYLSDARIKAYEKHAYDLLILKKLYKKYGKGRYNKMFRVLEDHNYSAYVGSVNSDKEQGKARRGVNNKRDDFYKRVKSEVLEMQKIAPADHEISYVLDEIDKETFLPKQLTSANGVIPYQVHLKELRKILSNAEKYLTFLEEKDETGLSASEKIIQLFAFQIPYYVGPLYNDGDPSNNAWVYRKEEGKVYPWNFEAKVDVKASSEEFIRRMVRRCTYLQNEDVLPKSSLIYERFLVLNELNNLRINGVPVEISLKQDLYRDLFRREKKVTAKKVQDYLIKCGLASNQDTIDLSGIDGDFKSSLSSYLRFREIFGVDVLTYEQEQIAEKIIFWSTVYGDSRSFLRDRIRDHFGDKLTEAQIKRICGIRFRDWGRLSKAMLELEGADRNTGEVLSIINRMWEENVNFMECLSDRYTYLETIQAFGNRINKTFDELEYEDLEELYISAPVRRMVWQTVLVVKDIIRGIGYPPSKIFVEMARDAAGKNGNERKESRKRKFADLYKKCKDEGRDWSKEIEEIPEARFRSKKLYLYYTQKGRCMYTGEPIDLADLFNNNLYDIDHIYPRHFVKDDSIEKNLVLVRKQLNNRKSDSFPIEAEIRSSRYGWWKHLCEGGFITKEKFDRLTRTTQFSAEELAAFISRQIVETRQGTKTITDIFEASFPKAEVIYSKAGVVSDFRHHFGLIKCREVNNFHHANDAYLNIVVGNTYNVKFTKYPVNYIKDYQRDPEKYKYHMDKLFDYPVLRGSEIAWKTRGDESIRIVKDVMSRNTPLVTRMNYEAHGQLWDMTLYSAKEAAKAKGIGYVPINMSDPKMSNVCRYGGYKKYAGAYFFLVEHTVKGKRIRTLEAMPLYLKDKLNTIEKMEAYCRKDLAYQDPSIRMKRIKMYSLIKVNGYFIYLTGRTGNQLLVSNAVEMKMSQEWSCYIRRLFTDNVNIDDVENRNQKYRVSKEKNVQLYGLLTDKHCNGIYAKRPTPVGEKLKLWKDKFKELPTDKQVYVLRQILQLSSNTNQGADLREIGGGLSTGISKLNKRIDNNKEFKLISLTPAGLCRVDTDLLTV